MTNGGARLVPAGRTRQALRFAHALRRVSSNTRSLRDPRSLRRERRVQDLAA
jgi:hypothetical protein